MKVRGQKVLAEALGVGRTTVWKWNCRGWLDAAIVWRIGPSLAVYDVEMARKSVSRHNEELLYPNKCKRLTEIPHGWTKYNAGARGRPVFRNFAGDGLPSGKGAQGEMLQAES